MNEVEKIIEVVKKTLNDNTAYRLSKETGLALSPIQRLKNGESGIENMTLTTAKKLYEFAKKNEENA